MKKIISAVLLLASSLSFAGDAAKLTHVGFSADGKNYAFMESGVQDGSGFAYARIRFLDVAKNAFNAPAVNTQEDENTKMPGDLVKTEAAALKAAEASLKKLNISTAIKGDILVSRKITDVDTRSLNSATFTFLPGIAGYPSHEQFKVKLTATDVKTSNGYCLNEGMAKKLKVDIQNLSNKAIKILQNDSTLPSSRGCAHAYEIEDVVSQNYGDSVVVLIRVFTLGFEGEDVRYMAVSGSLK
jgi:predicted secreted protein